jgi:hypothetical protein
MSVQQYIHREATGTPHSKIPFILAMIDKNGTLVDMPFPPQEGLTSTDRIMGVELMVNPRTISNNQSKIINRTQTMTSFIEDHWGDEMDTLSFQGQTAAFVLGGNDIYSIKNSSGDSPTRDFLKSGGLSDPKIAARSLLFNFTGTGTLNLAGMGINDNEIGLTVSQRRQSVSYRQFKRMVDLIRANGCFFDTMGLLSKRYFMMLSYGSSSYRGYFDNIDITEEASSPYKFTFTVTFKVIETIFSYVDKNVSYNASERERQAIDFGQALD